MCVDLLGRLPLPLLEARQGRVVAVVVGNTYISYYTTCSCLRCVEPGPGLVTALGKSLPPAPTGHSSGRRRRRHGRSSVTAPAARRSDLRSASLTAVIESVICVRFDGQLTRRPVNGRAAKLMSLLREDSAAINFQQDLHAERLSSGNRT